MMHPAFRRRRKTNKAGRIAVKVPMQIIIRNLAHSEALEARVRESVSKLEDLHPHIVSCRVTVEESHRHQHQGRQFQVRIDARVPGKEFVASHDHDEDVYIALRDAVLAMRRQLEDAAKVSRGEIKLHSRPKGEDSESAGDA
jgi:ribosomal subunit interface protein